MKPVPWDWDYLIHLHFEGSLTEEQGRALNARLRSDSRLRRRLAELAFEQALLAEGLGGSDLRPSLAAERPAAAPLLKPAPPKPPSGKGRRGPRKKSTGDSDQQDR
jgi:anti-sigma factor RsiW